MKKWVTVSGAAKILNCTRQQVYNLIASDHLKAGDFGIDKRSIDAYKAHQINKRTNYVSIDMACAILGQSRRAVLRLIADGVLSDIRVEPSGRTYLGVMEIKALKDNKNAEAQTKSELYVQAKNHEREALSHAGYMGLLRKCKDTGWDALPEWEQLQVIEALRWELDDGTYDLVELAQHSGLEGEQIIELLENSNSLTA